MSLLGKVEEAPQAPVSYTHNGGSPSPPSGYIAPIPTRYCCIVLNDMDKIRLIGTPPEIAVQLRPLIKQFWKEGIQKESVYQTNAHEFKLISNPWRTSGPAKELV